MSLNYQRTFTDEEEKILLDSILDIKQWIDGMIDGKLNNCTKRLAVKRRKELIDSGNLTIPAKDIDLVKNAFADPNYKDRKKRDEDIKLGK